MRKVRQTGFTLLELMIVVAIIGLLATVALPQYSRYVDRSKIVESMVLVSKAKQAFEIWWAEGGSSCPLTLAEVYPNAVNEAALFPYVEEIQRHKDEGNNSGTICGFKIKFQATNNPEIDGSWMIWYNNMKSTFRAPSGNESISWSCVADHNAESGDDQVLGEYLPSSCRQRSIAGASGCLPMQCAYWF